MTIRHPKGLCHFVVPPCTCIHQIECWYIDGLPRSFIYVHSSMFHLHFFMYTHLFTCIYSFIQFTLIYSNVSYHMNQFEGAGRFSRGAYIFYVQLYSFFNKIYIQNSYFIREEIKKMVPKEFTHKKILLENID